MGTTVDAFAFAGADGCWGYDNAIGDLGVRFIAAGGTSFVVCEGLTVGKNLAFAAVEADPGIVIDGTHHFLGLLSGAEISVFLFFVEAHHGLLTVRAHPGHDPEATEAAFHPHEEW